MRELITARDAEAVKILLERSVGTGNAVRMERMGGLTNRTYKVTLADGRVYIVRIPGEGTETLINRSHEKISTALACKLGIDAELLYFGETGEKVSAYIPGAVTMSPETMGETVNLEKAAQILYKLHTCRENTGVPFEVFDMAASYEKIIRDNQVPLYDDYDAVKFAVLSVKQRVDQQEIAPVPCHNDPLCENWVLDSDGRMHLIDWEYAGMNDAMWDLADISIEASLSKQQESILLSVYFGREPNREEEARFQANKLYLDYLWALWGKARVPFDGESMEAYAAERYHRLKKNLSDFE